MRTRKTKSSVQLETLFDKVYEHTTDDGFVIQSGDIIKIVGQYGLKFKFDCITTNPITGAKWVDCYELERGLVARSRSFPIEDIKRIPKKRPRKARKNVN